MRLSLQNIDTIKGWLLPESLQCQGSILWVLDPVRDPTARRRVQGEAIW